MRQTTWQRSVFAAAIGVAAATFPIGCAEDAGLDDTYSVPLDEFATRVDAPECAAGYVYAELTVDTHEAHSWLEVSTWSADDWAEQSAPYEVDLDDLARTNPQLHGEAPSEVVFVYQGRPGGFRAEWSGLNGYIRERARLSYVCAYFDRGGFYDAQAHFDF